MSTLLVVDDEESLLYSFRQVFAGERMQVLTAATAAEGLKQIRAHNPDVVVLDLQLPDASGLEVFQKIQAHDAKKPVIFITAHGTTATAIEAMKRGAFEYLVKPVDLERLNLIIERAFEAARLMHVPAVLPVDDHEDRIAGRSLVMQEMCKTIGRVAPQDVNVLILGESGTGKELVARAIYRNSTRADKPFLAINCAAIPEALLESELFGHEEGAFTGAHRRRIGKFEQCNGGTLFLDEIGDMSPSLQAKMLRVLQEQRFERVGSNETQQTQVRVLTATNQNLEERVVQGMFRKDLYFRIKVVTIGIPPLRDRLGDVAELAHYYLYRYDRELGLDFRSFAPEALDILQSYSWPGNVRELQSVVKQAMLSASGHILLPEFFPETLRNEKPSLEPPSPGGSGFDLCEFVEGVLERGETDVYAKVLDRVDRVVLARVLRQTHGHQVRASEVLGLNRATLRTKMRSLDMVVDKVVTGDPGDPQSKDDGS
jgi:two-component system nitrogen regulation response regulator GlnG